MSRCPVAFICIYYSSFIIDCDNKQSLKEWFFIFSPTDSKMLLCFFYQRVCFCTGVKLCQFWFTLKNRAIMLFWVLSSPSSSPTSSSSPLSLFISNKSVKVFRQNLKCVWLPRNEIHVHLADNGAFYFLTDLG